MRKLIVAFSTTVLLLTLAPSAWATQDTDPNTEPDTDQCDETPTITVDPEGRVVFPRTNGDANATITIETDDDARTCEPVQYAFASYTAEGDTWPTSGLQKLFGSDLLNTRQPGEYTLTVPVPDCFYQIDLWEETNFVPQTIEYPDPNTPAQLVSAENGGTEGCEDDNPGPGPGPGPGPNPGPGPQPTNHPRADVTPPTCDEHTFKITLNNERSDLSQQFEIRLNGKTLTTLTVAAGESRMITRHAEDGDRLQVFAIFQLAEADAELGRVCEDKDKPEHDTHISTTNGHHHGRGPTTATLANTGANTGLWIVLFAVFALLGTGAILKARQIDRRD